MTAGPGDQGAAGAARGYLRASHADREHVVDVLKAAFVQGRLTKDEMDARVGQTFASQTYGELAALAADLPPGLITTPRPPKAAQLRTRPLVSKVVAGAALVILPPAMLAAVFITGSDALGKVATLVVAFFFMAWIIAGAQVIANWRDKRFRGQLPPRPAQGGQASSRLPSADPRRQLRPADPGHRHTTEAARRCQPLLVRLLVLTLPAGGGR